LFKAGIIDKDDHADNVEIVGTSGKVSENSVARFSLIAESELGHIFNEDGVDIYKALQERATILFILNPLIYPELSPLFGRLVLVDAKKAVSKLFDAGIGRTFFIFDEINVYASTALIDLVNKSRSANVTCILATQSLSDLSGAEDDNFKEQVIENCNNYIVMRQNSAVNSEAWANILGTRNTMEVTYQLQAQSGGATAETGMGSAKLVREYIYHPDTIKALGTGKAFFLSRDTGQHCKVSIHKPF
jgi:type IV secretory pathway TraG/TraD family ATPase VirD4